MPNVGGKQVHAYAERKLLDRTKQAHRRAHIDVGTKIGSDI